ncbi:class I SAM-dependent methyltransferase [Bradyrhizobium sp. BRP22]|uniref:class I SAM-dependent methyltransferase n=1 Tax=Bradyrhizobium sp. BRP22 TaxID=2793821 RepID=UPI001CD58008|nr:class I SAM-dependent methyltransferase [Bradyrhizobium sp. BRP22]MCA1452081.1 class I SAM-dependent methyltransferase [Bradyrhizobium sp. BRP22]
MEIIDEIKKELMQVYALLSKTDQERISYAKQLNEALLELGPARFNSNHYLKLHAESRIIELDFPVSPKYRDWSKSPHVQKLKFHFENRHTDWRDVLIACDRFMDSFLRIPNLQQPDEALTQPYWSNGWIPGLDAVLLYYFVATTRPRIYFEVGSGNSTKFVRKAINDYGLSTRIISVDPSPRAEIDLICDQVHRVGLEALDLNVLNELTPTDLVFVDNSHRSFPNSDVTVFFMEVLGRLPRGLLYGIHDIFLPDDYPGGWAPRYYNEQYLLASYLFGGADGDTIEFPAGYVSNQPDLIQVLDRLWKDPDHEGILPHGGSFWLRKG